MASYIQMQLKCNLQDLHQTQPQPHFDIRSGHAPMDFCNISSAHVDKNDEALNLCQNQGMVGQMLKAGAAMAGTILCALHYSSKSFCSHRRRTRGDCRCSGCMQSSQVWLKIFGWRCFSCSSILLGIGLITVKDANSGASKNCM